MAIENVDSEKLNANIADNKAIIVKYYADWCGSCKLFAPKYRRLSEDDKFSKITFLEVNAEQNPEARKLGGVNNLPFFSVFKSGKLIEGTATSKEEKVVELLDKLN